MNRSIVRGLVVLLGAAIAMAVLVSPAGATAKGGAAAEPQLVDDSTLKAMTTTEGGAAVLPTTRTIPHWWGSAFDSTAGLSGTTYGYNMVGADPYTCSGSACTVHVQVDITPINVNVGGRTYNVTADLLSAVLASPQFATNDYGSTPYATDINGGKGGDGSAMPLSQLDAGNALQLQDATMRAQFNKTGSSSYHLILDPVVKPAVTFDVPQNQGTLLRSRRGVVFGDVNISWWSSQIKNLETTADPTHLPLYLTNSVMLFIKSPGNCCVIGYHGTKATGVGNGSANSNGNAPVQTFAWSSYVQPGIFNPNTDWALQDIHALSHEIAEWADDPFVNNWVNPWLTPTAPQYGCTNILETGDPVVGIGFAKGASSYAQGANPNGTQSADGYYHPEDEALLPWFMRTAPNTTSEPTQSPSANVGRYTLMGDLNPFPGFRQPATGC